MIMKLQLKDDINLGVQSPLRAVLDPTNSLLAVHSYLDNQQVVVIDLQSREIIKVFKQYFKSITRLFWLENEFACFSYDPNPSQLSIQVVGLESGKTLNLTSGRVWNSAAYAKKTHRAAIASGTKILIVDLNNLEIMCTADKHKDVIININFSSNENYLASVGTDLVTRVWDTESLKPIRAFRSREPKDAIFTPDDQILLVATVTGHIYAWDLRTFEKQIIDTKSNKAISVLIFDKEGNNLYTVDWSGRLRIWQVTR